MSCIFLLADLFYNHGFILVMLGKTTEGIEYLKKSLTLASLFDNHTSLKDFTDDIKEHFGEDFLNSVKNFQIPLSNIRF